MTTTQCDLNTFFTEIYADVVSEYTKYCDNLIIRGMFPNENKSSPEPEFETETVENRLP